MWLLRSMWSPKFKIEHLNDISMVKFYKIIYALSIFLSDFSKHRNHVVPIIKYIFIVRKIFQLLNI